MKHIEIIRAVQRDRRGLGKGKGTQWSEKSWPVCQLAVIW